jgi:hypothetical protein
MASASVTVTVSSPNTPPTLSILSPANGSVLAESLGLTLSGSAYDVQDGNISSKIVWSSSLNGTLGTGASLTVVLSPGTQIITASVTDSSGLTTKSSVSVTIPMPTLVVSVATDAASYVNRNNVNVTVTVSGPNGPVAGAAVTVNINTAAGRVYTYTATTDSTGKALVTAYQVNSKRDGIGTYTLSVGATMTGYNSGSASTTFKVTK